MKHSKNLSEFVSIALFLFLGFVITAVIVCTLQNILFEATTFKIFIISVGFLIGYMLSVVGLVYLSKKYSKKLLGYNPDEIALLFSENKSIIDQLNEAVITVDQQLNITTINQKAIQLFGLSKEDIGKSYKEVFDYIDYGTIINDNLHFNDKHCTIKDLNLLYTVFPLYCNDKVIGATSIFRQHYEVDSLVDQVEGYRKIVEVLRSQKHEFQNKLHVILGLVKMKDYQKVEDYITEHVYTTNLASDYYTSRLKDDRILALFIGKEIQSKESNVSLMLTSDSFVEKNHSPISSDDIVLVLGNLIDNALEAYSMGQIDEKRIVVDLFEDDESINITVIDQAGGIDPTIIDKMFQRGVSTKKGTSRGTGLSLVNEIVALYDGEKNVSSSIEETRIEILLRKVKR
jgi:sensor histidine kinase regulating citrate/malate metabolism